MHIDLRDWLQAVERRGELHHISGANWDLEMSGMAEIVQAEGKEPKPVLLFDSVPGFPKEYRTLFGLLASPWRIAQTLGLQENQLDRMSLVRNWRKKSLELRPIPPSFVAAWPVHTTSDSGDQVDLLKFPSPRFHELDRSRYIGTGHTVIQKDPDAGWVNLGTYRVMLVDRNRLALHMLERQHGSLLMHQKYFSRGRVMPVAIAIGMDPVLWWTSCRRLTPWGVSEYDYAGGIKGEPIEVVAGPHTGLPLPARAEIVIEGECHPGELVDEGPFGEWCGYYANLGLATVPEPVIRVKAVHYRDNPILTCEHPAIPSHDASALAVAVGSSVALWNRLEAAGIPGIRGVWCYSEAAGAILFNVISIEQMYAGHARDVGLIAAHNPEIGRYNIIVEEDIDPSDLKQVVWAMVSRNMPDRAIQMLYHCGSQSSDPAIPPEEKRKYRVAPKPLLGSRVIIDACRPMEWKEEWYPVARISDELRTKIIQRWQPVLSGLLNNTD